MTDTLTLSPVTRFLEALRPALMGPRLAALATVGTGTTAGEPDTDPRSCHVLDAKYEPGVRAMVLYDQGGQLLRADLLDGEVPDADDADVVEPGMAVSVFPRDAELPTLPEVMDPARVGPALAAERGPWSTAGRRSTARVTVTLLRYRPGKRATVLLTPLGAPPLVAKVYHDPVKAAAVVDESPRLQSLTSSGGVLDFAPLRGFLPDLRLVVQQPVRGRNLEVMLGGPRGSAREARAGLQQAARCLAELHAGEAMTSRPRPVEKELMRFRERAGRIATVDPALGGAADRLAERLLSTLGELPAALVGTVHGDCKPSQFLIGGDRVYLLDLDHCGVGEQEGDVGTFLASLRQREIRHILGGPRRGSSRAVDDGTAAALGEVFTTTYLDAARATDRLARIRWHEAVALERKALRAFARAPLSPLPSALIREAGRRLDDLGRAA